MGALRQLQQRRFYGSTLELLEDKEAQVAFGLWVQEREGRILIRERFTFANTNSTGVWPLLPPEWQFGVRKTNYNTQLGAAWRVPLLSKIWFPFCF